ncbi:hypothetical protein B0H19DRAFT_1234732 [Mycena capillaripes]|nr:hypothetical protein B0H19DRAFT_1234732 [Mycena capillaripes]
MTGSDGLLVHQDTIISFRKRSFQLPSTSGSDDQETVYFNDYRGSGVPPSNIGTAGDTYINVNASTLYARCADAWMLWPGPTKRLESLPHPEHPTFSLWCNTTRNRVSWMQTSKIRIIVTSASEVVSDIIAAEASESRKCSKRKPDDNASCDDSDSDQPKRARTTKSPIPSTARAAPAVLAWRRCQLNSSLPASAPTHSPSFDAADPNSLPPLVPIHNFSVTPIRWVIAADTPPTVMHSAPVIANFIHATKNRPPVVPAPAAGERMSGATNGVEEIASAVEIVTASSSIRTGAYVEPREILNFSEVISTATASSRVAPLGSNAGKSVGNIGNLPLPLLGPPLPIEARPPMPSPSVTPSSSIASTLRSPIVSPPAPPRSFGVSPLPIGPQPQSSTPKAYMRPPLPIHTVPSRGAFPAVQHAIRTNIASTTFVERSAAQVLENVAALRDPTRPQTMRLPPQRRDSERTTPVDQRPSALRQNAHDMLAPRAAILEATSIQSTYGGQVRGRAVALHAANIDLQNRNVALMAGNDVLYQEREQLMRERGELLQQRDELLRERDGMQRAVRLIKVQMADVVNHDSAVTHTNILLIEENTAVKAKNHGLQISNSSLTTEVAALREQITTLHARNEGQNNSIRRLEEKIQVFKAENEVLKSKVKARGGALGKEPQNKDNDSEEGDPTVEDDHISKADDIRDVDPTIGNVQVKAEPLEEPLNATRAPHSGTEIEIIDLTLDSDDDADMDIGRSQSTVSAYMETRSNQLFPMSEDDSSPEDMGVQDIAVKMTGSGSDIEAVLTDLLTSDISLTDEAADQNEIELVLRAETEEILCPEGQSKKKIAQTTGEISDKEAHGAPNTKTRRLTRTQIEILWTYFEDDPSINIVCNPCNSMGAKYEMPSNTSLDELAAHSEAQHPEHCDALITQTRGMTDPEIHDWLKELDAE